MLKASSKSYFKKLVKQNVQVMGTSVPVRALKSNRVYLQRHRQDDNIKDTLDNFTTFEKHIALFRMNKEHRFNTLSTSYMKDLRRFLTTFNQDDEVKIILMSGAKNEHFSNGTDFRTLLHHVKEQEHDKVVEYLKDLYSLQTLVAKINKPIIGVAHGHAFNSGATLLQATGIPTSTMDTKLAFNEVTFGFVPHGGASYYLSRLPGELGTYLAVTGLSMSGVEAIQLDLTDMLIHKGSKYRFTLADIMDNIEFPMPSGYDNSNQRWVEGRRNKRKQNTKQPYQKSQFLVNSYKPQVEKSRMLEALRRRHENQNFDEFDEPRDRQPETVGQADYLYQKEMEKFNQSQMSGTREGTGYMDGKQRFYQNYFKYISSYVQEYSLFDFPEGGDTLKRSIQAIDRCFYANTMEEIIENLKRENTPFSKKCLDQINRNSMLSMKLALRMVRQARNMCYKSCLQNEINVALNKLGDKEFELGVKEVLMQPGKFGKSPQFSTEISDDHVNSYFAPNKFTEAVELDIVEKALLPTREYYREWSDQVRLFINEESTPQAEVRRYFDFELKNAMQARGIDLRDRAMDVPTARAYLYHQNQLERLQDHVRQRMEQMGTDQRLRDEYYDKVSDEIKKLQKAPKDFYKRVNEHIQAIFEESYLKKLNTVFEKSQEVHNLDKRRMYLRFKQFLMSSRIISFYDDKLQKLTDRHLNMPYKLPHLTENWEHSFLLQQHPEIETSVIHHISKVIGKKTVAPLEIAKQYISNPELAKQLTVLTFDQEQLKNLRKDILLDPSKYEKMLTANKAQSYSELPTRREKSDVRDESWLYWYRVLNDGKTPFDNIEEFHRYEFYKDFVSNIEKKALGTLQLIVQRLINDFEENEASNKIVNFDHQQKKGQNKETKRQQLQRLMNVLTETDTKVVDKPLIYAGNDAQAESGQLIKKTRSIDDVKRIIDKIIREDQHLKVLIPSIEDFKDNKMVQSLRDKLTNQLYQHIEFVLLNQNPSYPMSKEALEERLASVTNPQNSSEAIQRLAKLRIIDQFLTDHNAEQTIKQALQVSKTLFLHEASAEVEQIGRDIMSAFRVDVLNSQYILAYAMMTKHKDALMSPVVQKLLNYHAERDYEKYADEVDPTATLSFFKKNLIHILGDSLIPANAQKLPLNQKEKLLEKNVKEREQVLQQIDDQKVQKEKRWSEDLDNYTKMQMMQAVDDSDIEDLITEDPQLFLRDFNPVETDQLETIDEELTHTAQQIEDFIDPMTENMSVEHWLNIIWALQIEHHIDCRRIFRFGFTQELLDNMDLEADLKVAMGRKDATFENVAELAGYAKQVIDAFRNDMQHSHHQKSFESIASFYLDRHNLSEKDELGERGIFEQISEARITASMGFEKGTQLYKLRQIRKEILDFSNAQELLSHQNEVKESIQRLMIQAPAHIQKLVKEVIDNKSPYIVYEKVLECLINKTYSQLYKTGSFIDKPRLRTDIGRKDLFNSFMKDYKEIPCDVISLGLAKQTVLVTRVVQPNDLSEALEEEKPNLLNENMKAQIVHILDLVNEACTTIPNSRRKQIKLGDFLARHPIINIQDSFSVYANSIIKEKIEKVLGSKSAELLNKNPVEWDYNGYVTNPFSSELRADEVISAAKNGQYVDEAQTIKNDLKKELETPDEHDHMTHISKIVDEITGRNFQDDSQRLILDQVLLDAYNLVTLKEEMRHIRDMYRARLLNMYTRSEFSDEDVSQIINEYTELRFKELMLNSEFVDQINGPNSTYYLRMLREEVAADLDVSSEVQEPDELEWEVFQDKELMEYDAESIQNMNEFSNTEAVGFDNIEKRAAEPEKNRELAHQTLFDKLLAEYFVQKRQQIVNINELMNKMELIYGEQTINEHMKYKPGDAAYSKDPNQRKFFLDDRLASGSPLPLSYQKLIQDQRKDSRPYINPTSFTDLMDLDIATSKAINKGKSGLSREMSGHDLETDLSIPDYLPMFDVRRPPKEYVDHKLKSILEDVFEIRKRLEKTFTRNELLAYDRVLIKHLNANDLLARIKQQVADDKQSIIVYGQGVESEHEGVMDEFKQCHKQSNKQPDFNEGIKNEDALYKFLAYTAMLDKTRKEQLKKDKNDDGFVFEVNMFEQYYKKELMTDAKRPPREIDPKEYYEYKQGHHERMEPKYTPIIERQDEYFAEYQKYKEGKKEGYDRNKLFYILEQFYAKSKEEQDKGSQLENAQKTIVEYFSKPENTEFFMRNKIQ